MEFVLYQMQLLSIKLESFWTNWNIKFLVNPNPCDIYCAQLSTFLPLYYCSFEC